MTPKPGSFRVEPHNAPKVPPDFSSTHCVKGRHGSCVSLNCKCACH